jgi:putative hydrolase of the HAD superfamily
MSLLAMKNIKHYSFDLWQTLIKSNVSFKKARACYFHSNFNFKNKSLKEIEHIFREIDLMSNKVNEITGGNIDNEELYLFILYQINDNLDFITDISIKQIYNDIEIILFENPPVLYSNDTIEVLEKLKIKNPDITYNILSNTAFIKGHSLKIILNDLGLFDFFDFLIFSDEVGLSKPNEKIFNLLWQEIKKIRKDSDSITLDEVVHVGDNFQSDILGARKFGYNTFQINSNEKTIKDLESYAA